MFRVNSCHVLVPLSSAPVVMDVHVLLDAIAKCMSSEEAELNKVTIIFTKQPFLQLYVQYVVIVKISTIVELSQKHTYTYVALKYVHNMYVQREKILPNTKSLAIVTIF